MKKTLLIVIDNLGRGGAEVLLVGLLPHLNEKFKLILVTLSEENDFNPGELHFYKKYTLKFKGKFSFISSIFKLRKIIRQHKPHLVHAHLHNSSIVTRAACPQRIPLVITLHSIMSKNVFDNSFSYRLAELILKNNNQTIIAVSKEVLKDYDKTMGLPARSYVLYNYIDDRFFSSSFQVKNISPTTLLRLVAVGNIKKTKNYSYLLKAFEQLKNYPISLDIYGGGNEEDIQALQNEINIKQLNVNLLGKAQNVYELLPAYDLYVLCSLFEGFGISAIEAMAMGLPLLLSDLDVLREVTHNNALFFDVNVPDDFVKIIKGIFENKFDLANFSSGGVKIVENNYTKQNHICKLYAIYRNLGLD